MKTKHLLLFISSILALGSCTTAYRTGQTPDDVYYSPAPQQVDYVTTQDQQDRDSYASHNNSNYNYEDYQIRKGIANPVYRSNVYLDFGLGNRYSSYDYFGGYNYNPYVFNPYAYKGIYNYPYNYNSYYSPLNSYYYPASGSYYYPYSQPVYYKTTNYPTSARRFNTGAYTNRGRANNNPAESATDNVAPARTFPSKPANTTGVGGFIRRVFTPSNNTPRPSVNNTTNNNNYNNNNNNSTPARSTYTPSSSGSSRPSSSGSGGSAPSRTFR